MLAMLVVPALLAACGQGTSVSTGSSRTSPAPVLKDTLAAAASATRSAGTVRLTTEMTESSSQGTMILHGSGMFRLRPPIEGSMRVTADLPVSNTSFTVDERLIGPVLYMRSRELAAEIPVPTKPWIKLDFEKMGKREGIDFGALMNAQGSNPAQSLAYLQAASGGVQDLGTDTVDGVSTTHYHATVDPRKAMTNVIRMAPASQRASLRSTYRHLFALTGALSYPVDAWVDAAGRVRRVRVTMSLPSNSEPVTMTTGFSDFGAPVHVLAPPASQTTDLLALAAKAR